MKKIALIVYSVITTSSLLAMDFQMSYEHYNNLTTQTIDEHRGTKRAHHDSLHQMGPEQKKIKIYKDIKAYVVVKNRPWCTYKDFMNNKRFQSSVQLFENRFTDLQDDYMVPVFVYNRTKDKQTVQTCEYNALNGKDDVIAITYLPYSWLARMDNSGLRLLYASTKGVPFDTCIELHQAPSAKRGVNGKFEIQSADDFKNQLSQSLGKHIDQEMSDYYSDAMSF
jgi:hypothetical protein